MIWLDIIQRQIAISHVVSVKLIDMYFDTAKINFKLLNSIVQTAELQIPKMMMKKGDGQMQTDGPMGHSTRF